MRHKRYIFLALLLLSAAAAAARLPALAQEIDPGPGDQAQHVVFTKEIAAANKAKLEPLGVSAPYWTPSREQIREMQERLSDYLQANAGAQHDNLWLKLTNYKLQFLGFTSDESKMVYVNAFCRAGWDNTNRWLKELITAKSGGDCYFQLKYDLEQASYYELTINREADS